jgi:glycosyltransferase involved in cell wall biosynthesis
MFLTKYFLEGPMCFLIRSLLISLLLLFPQLIRGDESGIAPQGVCLNMIVKNESKVITRCLNSVLPVIDYWVIVDTGSTDGTQKIIKDFMRDKGVEGELYERPWVNFAHNRNEALNLAKGKRSYLLFMDADDYLVCEPDFKLPYLDKDLYFVMANHPSGTKYGRLHFVNNCKEWVWEGVLHEALMAKPSNEWRSSATLEKVNNTCTADGARSNDTQKYQKDAVTLENALKEDPNNTRYVFYLAQSYRDAGNGDLALKNYEKRAAMAGWDQENFIALLEAAKLQEQLKYPSEDVIKGYERAYQYRPSRAEPVYYLANYLRSLKKYDEAYRWAKIGAAIPYSKDILFVEAWIYDYGMLLELSVSAYWTDRYKECQEISHEILKKSTLSSSIRTIVENNLKFANEKLAENEKLAQTESIK